MSVRRVNRFFLLAAAPFIGMIIWLLLSTTNQLLDDTAFAIDESSVARLSISSQAANVGLALQDASSTAIYTTDTIEQVTKLYRSISAETSRAVKQANLKLGKPERIYDQRINLRLGALLDSAQSNKITARLFYIQQKYYKGYALKIRLKDDSAMRLALGQDKYGGSETTLAAVRRTDAIAGVNAGGFADGNGLRYPIGTTIVNGKYAGGFQPTVENLFFVGLDQNRNLIGGRYETKQQLEDQKPLFGASFVPVLLQNGIKQPIPDKWQQNPLRAPRTVIGNFKDGQLFFLVTDGYNEEGHSGATLSELQQLLSQFGVIDAYNLDGGGSSTMVFKGRVVNEPSDGELRKLATNFLFFQ